MSDNDSTEVTPITEQESATDDSQVDWKAKAREWEAKSKANHKRIQELEPKAQQYDALEAASQTELERAQAQAQSLQQELASTQRQALLASVALAKGLPASLARRLQGESQEELEADADELLSQFGNNNQQTTRSPAPDFSQGSSANGGATASPGDQFAAIVRSMPG